MPHPTPAWIALALPLLLVPAQAAPSARLQAPEAGTMVALAEPMRADEGGRWVVVSNHNHTRESHDSHLTIAQLARQAAAEGIEAVVLTDHNSVNYFYDPAYRAPQPVTLIGGEEWSSDHGHAGLIGLEGGRPLKGGLDVERMLAMARARHGVAIVNHPFLTNLSWHAEAPEDGIDGIEVWNNYWGTPLMGNGRALGWWQEALVQGRRLTAVGGGDYHGHFGSDVARPVNLVWARDASAEAVVAGIRAGRVVVAAGPYAPRLDLAVEGAHIGETATLAGSGEASIRVRIRGGRARTVVLVGPGGPIARHRVTEDDQSYEVRAVFSGPGFVRAELRDERTVFRSMVALTNPVWVEPAGTLTAGR